MANLIENYLKISAEKEDALKKAMLVIQSEILSPPSPYKVSTRDIFDKENQMHIFEMGFDTHWSPPFRTYMELKSIEGISIDATLVNERDHYDTRYRWTGEGCNLIAVQTNLNDWDSDYQDFQDYLKLKISNLQKQRDNLDLAINALRSLGAPAVEGDFSP